MSPSAASDRAGHSGAPLPQKLGFKDGQRVQFLDLPESLAGLATARAFADVECTGWSGLAAAAGLDVIHGFTASRAVLENAATPLRRGIRADGMVWISWPKQASNVPSDITENTVREVLLPTGLVDVKVAAVDATWSGLKLVIRKELR